MYTKVIILALLGVTFGQAFKLNPVQFANEVIKDTIDVFQPPGFTSIFPSFENAQQCQEYFQTLKRNTNHNMIEPLKSQLEQLESISNEPDSSMPHEQTSELIQQLRKSLDEADQIIQVFDKKIEKCDKIH